ncbi:MAG TPA: response regulator [Puia sp.]|uniref:response regulator n=1 Tax=Puia sp. TaxID=2045100 RepID=UPI002C6E8581|nr:response regulator [Puia sp.]HVU94244.1 response regulator [Puia sp.]
MKKKIIMVVEDDELDVMSVRRSLNTLDLPYELYTAFNGIEALELLRGAAAKPAMDFLPDILLLDLNMPRMNGLEFLTVIRADDRLKSIPVYIMTTSGEQTDRAATDRLGVSGYLIKPMGYASGHKRVDSMEHFVQFYLRKLMTGGEDN